MPSYVHSDRDYFFMSEELKTIAMKLSLAGRQPTVPTRTVRLKDSTEPLGGLFFAAQSKKHAY